MNNTVYKIMNDSYVGGARITYLTEGEVKSLCDVLDEPFPEIRGDGSLIDKNGQVFAMPLNFSWSLDKKAKFNRTGVDFYIPDEVYKNQHYWNQKTFPVIVVSESGKLYAYKAKLRGGIYNIDRSNLDIAVIDIVE